MRYVWCWLICYMCCLKVCDYAMSVGTGVSLKLRKQLLAVWVLCKQMLHQPLSANTYDINEAS